MMKNFTLNIYLTLTFVFCLLFGLAANAQPSGKKMGNLKIAFITKEIDLNEKEAQAFWPTYNKHEKRIIENKNKLKEVKRKESETTSDAEKEKLMTERMRLESEKASLKSSRHADLKKVLSTNNISKLYTAEDNFLKYVFRQYRGRNK